MQVLINSDNTIQMHNKLSDSIGAYITNVLQRFEPYLVRVEVHLTGENSKKNSKRAPVEKRCLLEARPKHHQPLVSSKEAYEIDVAFSGAADKLQRLLENTFGRLSDKRRRARNMATKINRLQSLYAAE
jgi:ribosome-associated translation inhibitor RaiA